MRGSDKTTHSENIFVIDLINIFLITCFDNNSSKSSWENQLKSFQYLWRRKKLWWSNFSYFEWDTLEFEIAMGYVKFLLRMKKIHFSWAGGARNGTNSINVTLTLGFKWLYLYWKLIILSLRRTHSVTAPTGQIAHKRRSWFVIYHVSYTR